MEEVFRKDSDKDSREDSSKEKEALLVHVNLNLWDTTSVWYNVAVPPSMQGLEHIIEVSNFLHSHNSTYLPTCTKPT